MLEEVDEILYFGWRFSKGRKNSGEILRCANVGYK